MKSTSNIQHPTSNPQCSSVGIHWMLNVGCWILNVSILILFACLGGGFAAHLSASEPSDLPTTAADPAIVVAANSTPPAATPTRVLTDADLLELLTATLQKEYVKDKGDLELRFARPWNSRSVP